MVGDIFRRIVASHSTVPMRLPHTQGLSACPTSCRPSLIWIPAPQSCRLTALGRRPHFPQFLLSGCFTAPHHSCGKTRRAQCTTSHKVKGGEQGDPLMNALDNIRHLLLFQTGFTMGNASTLFWMICMLPRIPNELWIATRSWVKNCGTTPRYAFTMARWQCGTAEARSLSTLVVWRELPDSWILQRE